MNLGGPDLIIILLIVLVLFGAKRLPDLAKGMGQAMREFHKAKDEFGHELNSAGTPAPRAPVATQPVVETQALAEPTTVSGPVDSHAPVREHIG